MSRIWSLWSSNWLRQDLPLLKPCWFLLNKSYVFITGQYDAWEFSQRSCWCEMLVGVGSDWQRDQTSVRAATQNYSEFKWYFGELDCEMEVFYGSGGMWCIQVYHMRFYFSFVTTQIRWDYSKPHTQIHLKKNIYICWYQ